MINRSLLVSVLASLSIVSTACSKSDTKDVSATKAVESQPAVSPVAPAPAPAPPATKEARALQFLHDLAAKKVTIDQFDAHQTFAFVDLSEKPQGGRNNVQKGVCSFEELREQMMIEASDMEDSFANDQVSCKEGSGDRVVCTVRAGMEGDQTLTYLLSSAGGRITPLGYAKRETFMIDDDARLAKDDKTIDAAFAKLTSQPCSGH